MNYWLIVTTAENLQVIKEKHLVGISERDKNTVEQVKKGDKCAIYVRQVKNVWKVTDSAITGIFEITAIDYSYSKIFHAPPTRALGTFPLRLKLRPVSPFIDRTVPFKPLVAKLSFIVNKQKWGTSLQRGLIALPEPDYQVIVSALQKEP